MQEIFLNHESCKKLNSCEQVDEFFHTPSSTPRKGVNLIWSTKIKDKPLISFLTC